MEINRSAGKLSIWLPITTPTGKIRVKRARSGLEAEPVACRSKEMGANDYLEWQISYDTDSLHEPSVVKSVKLRKDTGVRYGCELVKLIVEGKKAGIIQDAALGRLIGLAAGSIRGGIEEDEKIYRLADPKNPQSLGEEFGFARFFLKVPNYIKDGNRYAVEIKIAHKQRAVGNQAMVYVHLPLKDCESMNGRPLVGRIADKGEKVLYTMDRANSELVLDTALAFIIASEDHRADLKQIFEKLPN